MARSRGQSIFDRGEAVLRAPRSGRADELLSLIHEVNPTGRELDEQSASRRYSLKSRLQSLLVTTFTESVHVERLADSDDVVGLRYGPTGRDGCHAVLSELDDAARSIVRLKLDTGSASSAWTAASSAPASRASGSKRRDRVPGLLEEARAALAEYDYALAQQRCEDALHAADGAVAEAEALLDFLTGQLAAWPEALALQTTLPAATLVAPEIRGLLAWAAAHNGEPERAAALLEGAAQSRAAQTHFVLARHFLGLGAEDAVNRHLEAGRALEPTHPEVMALSVELSKLGALQRRPAEAALEELAAHGDDERSLMEARALLARWPESVVARQLVKRLTEKRRALERQALINQAEAAAVRGDFDRAAGLWLEAQLLGSAGLAEKIAFASAEGARRRRLAEIEEVSAALTAGLTAPVLARFVTLPADVRKAVVARIGSSVAPDVHQNGVAQVTSSALLEWLDRAVGADGGRSDSQYIDALLAFVDAQRLPDDDAQARLALLEPHEAAYRRLAPATELLARSRGAVQSKRQAQAAALRTQASAALEAGQLVDAAELARRAVEVWPADGEAVAIERAARELVDDGRQRTAVRQLLERGSFGDALELVAARLLAVAEPRRAAWETLRREVAGRIAQELRLSVVAVDMQPASPEFSNRMAGPDLAQAISSDGALCWAVAGFDQSVFLRSFALRPGAPMHLLSFELNENCECADVTALEGAVVVRSTRGTTVELSTSTFEVLRFSLSEKFTPDSVVVEDSLRVPGSPYLWVATRAKEGREEKVAVYDVRHGRLHRELGEGYGVELLATPKGPRVLVRNFGHDARVFSPAGAPETAIPERAEQIAPSPSAEGFIALREPDDLDAGGPLRLVRLEAGQMLDAFELPESWNERPHHVATSTSKGVCFARYMMSRVEVSVEAFTLTASGFERKWALTLPAEAGLVQDLRSRAVALAVPDAQGLTVVELAEAPPELSAASLRIVEPPPFEYSKVTFCISRRQHPGLGSEIVAVVEAPTPEARAEEIAAFVARHSAQPSELLELALALKSRADGSDGRRLRQELRTRYPEDPWVRYDAADEAAEEGRADAVLSWLEGVNVDALTVGAVAHLHHLRALARYMRGDFADAAAGFRRVLSVEGEHSCDVESWVRWMEVMDSDSAAHDPEDDAMGALFARIVRADDALANGDGALALRELDTPDVWRNLEVQIAARLVKAALMSPPTDPVAQFRRRLFIAAFRGTRNKYHSHQVLALGARRISVAELEELERAVGQ